MLLLVVVVPDAALGCTGVVLGVGVSMVSRVRAGEYLEGEIGEHSLRESLEK